MSSLAIEKESSLGANYPRAGGMFQVPAEAQIRRRISTEVGSLGFGHTASPAHMGPLNLPGNVISESRSGPREIGSLGAFVGTAVGVLSGREVLDRIKVSAGLISQPETSCGLRGIAVGVLSGCEAVERPETLNAPTRTNVASGDRGTQASLEVSVEAERRVNRYRKTAQAVYSIIEGEAKRLNLSPTVRVRSAWSHEYEDKTGIVIDVEIKGSNEERFSLWDSISVKLDHLADTLNKEEQVFLINDVSVVVVRG